MVERLKKIVEETGVKVVLSSSWRIFFDKTEDGIIPNCEKGNNFNRLLNHYNIFIYDITPYDRHRNRGNEIKHWLLDNPDVDDFIIIDDETESLLEYESKVIKTYYKYNNDCGLCDSHVKEAISKLKEDKLVKRKWVFSDGKN